MAKRHKRRKKSGKLGFRDRIAVGLGLKIALSLAVIVTFLSVVQCTVNKPEAPTWTSQLTVPLIDKRYDMSELVDRIDEPSLTLDSAGNPFFSIQEELDSVGVNAAMTISNISQSVGDILGLVSVSPDIIPPYTANFSDIIAFPAGLIPPAPFDVVYDGPVLNSFQSAKFNGGFVRTIVENNLGIYLDTVIVDLVDLTTFTVIGTGELLGGLPDGARDTLIIPLDGKTVGNRFRMQVHAHTPGATILTLSGKSLSLEMSLSDPIVIESGSAITPEITKNFSRKASISSPHQIRNATLESGTLALNMTNQTGLQVDMTITIPDLQLNGVPLTIIDTIAASSSALVNIDVTGYSLVPADIVAPQQFDINISAHVPSSSPNLVAVNSVDSLTATATLSNMAFSSIQGVFNSITTNFAPIASSIDVPNGFDSAQLTAATLKLEIDNASALGGSLNVNVFGSNGKSINLNGAIAAGAANAPVTTTIAHSTLSDFLDPIPSSYTVSGSVVFGDGVTVTDITKNDFIKSRVTIESPLEVVFDGSSVQLDVQSSSVDTSSIDLITNHLESATVNAFITNHLPTGINVTLVISNDSATLYSAPQVTIGPITVAPGVVDGSGITTTATVSSPVIVIDSADVQVLNNDPVYIGQLLTMSSSGGLPIRFVGDDFINIEAHIIVQYIFNDNF